MRSNISDLAQQLKKQRKQEEKQKRQKDKLQADFQKSATARVKTLSEEFEQSDAYKFLSAIAELEIYNLKDILPTKTEIVRNPRHIDWGYYTNIGPKSIKFKFQNIMGATKPDIVAGLMYINNNPEYAIVRSARSSKFLPSWHFSNVTHYIADQNAHFADEWKSFHSEDKLISFAGNRLTDSSYFFGDLIKKALIQKAERNKRHRSTNVVDLNPR